MAVVLEYSIYLVRWLNNASAQRVLQTPSNPLGLCEITTLPNAPKRLLVAPGHKVGSVQMMVSIIIWTRLVRLLLFDISCRKEKKLI